MSELTLKRHWFRFSLRTLFAVVTLVCVWLAWQIHFVRERNNLLQLVDEKYGYAGREIDSEPTGWRTWLLGDCGANIFMIRRNTPQHVRDRISTNFPEANIEDID
jgi:hypothetical protein